MGKWEERKLSEVVYINSGIALPKIFKEKSISGDIPFYKVAQMNNHERIMIDSELKFDTKIAKEARIKIFPKGSVLIPKRGGAILTNKKRTLVEDASYDSNIMGLKAKNEILSDDYLFLFMQSVDLSDFVDESTIPQINNKHIDRIKINYPVYLPEQQRIVAKLDGLFTKIDQAISLLEANLQHTQALMGSVLDEEFEKLKDKFKNLALEEVLKIKSGDFLSSKKMSNTNEYNVYGGNGINGTHNLFNLEGENIIIGRVGAKCGNVRLVNESIWVTDNAFYVSEIKKDITKEFLLEILRLLKLGDTANQAAQPVISFKGIRNLVMPIPDRKSQKVFCLKSQKLRMEKNKLIETQTQKLDHLKALKSSLLDQAFKGAL